MTNELHIACQNGEMEIVQGLIDRKVNLNEPHSSEGIPPLAFAVANGHLAIARLLLSNGAKASDPRGIQYNLLDQACEIYSKRKEEYTKAKLDELFALIESFLSAFMDGTTKPHLDAARSGINSDFTEFEDPENDEQLLPPNLRGFTPIYYYLRFATISKKNFPTIDSLINDAYKKICAASLNPQLLITHKTKFLGVVADACKNKNDEWSASTWPAEIIDLYRRMRNEEIKVYEQIPLKTPVDQAQLNETCYAVGTSLFNLAFELKWGDELPRPNAYLQDAITAFEKITDPNSPAYLQGPVSGSPSAYIAASLIAHSDNLRLFSREFPSLENLKKCVDNCRKAINIIRTIPHEISSRDCYPLDLIEIHSLEEVNLKLARCLVFLGRTQKRHVALGFMQNDQTYFTEALQILEQHLVRTGENQHPRVPKKDGKRISALCLMARCQEELSRDFKPTYFTALKLNMSFSNKTFNDYKRIIKIINRLQTKFQNELDVLLMKTCVDLFREDLTSKAIGESLTTVLSNIKNHPNPNAHQQYIGIFRDFLRMLLSEYSREEFKFPLKQALANGTLQEIIRTIIQELTQFCPQEATTPAPARIPNNETTPRRSPSFHRPNTTPNDKDMQDASSKRAADQPPPAAAEPARKYERLSL